MYLNRFTLINTIFFISCIINAVDCSPAQSALCFLTRQASSEIIQFALEVSRYVSSLDILIIVDDNNIITLPIFSSTVRLLQFNDTICIKYGFYGTNTLDSRKICSAWDKALYYFSRQSSHYSFVWFIEEDVFIPSVQAFKSVHELYSSSYDLVVGDIEYNTNGDSTNWYHWYLVPGTFTLPWARGMVGAIGCSRSLLFTINEYAKWRGQLTFIEFLFHTLSIQNNNMSIVTPYELDTIRYRDPFTLQQVQARPNNWWHPMKDLDKRRAWRQL